LWKLINDLSLHVGQMTPTEIYREYIKDAGVFDIFVVKEEALPRFITAWEQNGIGWLAISSKTGTNEVVCYYGTSVYNKEEFSRILQSVIDDCKAFGIPTKSDAEIQSIVEAYFE